MYDSAVVPFMHSDVFRVFVEVAFLALRLLVPLWRSLQHLLRPAHSLFLRRWLLLLVLLVHRPLVQPFVSVAVAITCPLLQTVLEVALLLRGIHGPVRPAVMAQEFHRLREPEFGSLLHLLGPVISIRHLHRLYPFSTLVLLLIKWLGQQLLLFRLLPLVYTVGAKFRHRLPQSAVS